MPLRTKDIARVEGLVRTCSIWRALDVVGDVPVLLILQAIWLQEHRFSDIQRRTSLPKVLLSERLRRLGAGGLVARRMLPGEGHPQYRLTGKGVALFPVTMMLQRWEMRWTAEPRQLAIEIVHRDCGSVTEPCLSCGACGGSAPFDALSWHDGPGMGLMAPRYTRRRQARARAADAAPALLFTESAALLGDRWASLIVRALMMGVDRFDDLIGETGMASNILSERLRWLADIGVLERVAEAGAEARARYQLTPKGADFAPVLIALQAWGDVHCAAPEGPPVVIRHDACGEALTPDVRCLACGGLLNIGNVAVRRAAAG